MPGTQLDTRIDMERLPRHIAIIMDGNGRWARERGLAHVEGHEAGSRSVRAVIEACRKLGVDALSLYAFSTENWRRSKFEVSALFRLLSKYIRQEIDEMHANNIRICFMGREEGLPKRALADMASCVERTKNNTALTVNIALNYGGRAEIVDATRRIARAVTDAQRAAVGNQSGGRVWLFLETEDFDRDHAAFLAAGAHFREAPRYEDYGVVAVFEDLYGNAWDLIEPARETT